RARSAANALQYLVFPLRWTGSQLLYLAPSILLLVLLYGRPAWTPPDDKTVFDRRYVTMLALGPFAVVTLLFGAIGRLPVAIWGYPLWSFAPLALLLWLPPPEGKRPLRRFAAGAIAILALFPLAYLVVEIGEPLLRDRRKATTYPGQTLADTVT